MFQLVPVCSTLHQLVSRCSNLFQLVSAFSTLFQAVPACSSLLQAVPACSSLLQAVPACFSYFQLVPAGFSLLKLVSSFFHFFPAFPCIGSKTYLHSWIVSREPGASFTDLINDENRPRRDITSVVSTEPSQIFAPNRSLRLHLCAGRCGRVQKGLAWCLLPHLSSATKFQVPSRWPLCFTIASGAWYRYSSPLSRIRHKCVLRSLVVIDTTKPCFRETRTIEWIGKGTSLLAIFSPVTTRKCQLTTAVFCFEAPFVAFSFCLSLMTFHKIWIMKWQILLVFVKKRCYNSRSWDVEKNHSENSVLTWVQSLLLSLSLKKDQKVNMYYL